MSFQYYNHRPLNARQVAEFLDAVNRAREARFAQTRTEAMHRKMRQDFVNNTPALLRRQAG